tara:strand:+ start:412 stop:546 length:135 start_codon:yes stop_codon:yes gene_type:complete
MSKQDNNDLIPKLALGFSLFIALKFVPKVLAWINKTNKKQGEIL